VNVVDSSAWLEYFADGPQAGLFAKVIGETGSLVVPSLAIYEVFKRVLQQRGDDAALQAVAFMEQGLVVDLDRATALAAAELSVLHKLPMADSIMLATARRRGATLWTQDGDFAGLEGVRYFPKA
jgi:predicted nucleic acid-binding protein